KTAIARGRVVSGVSAPVVREPSSTPGGRLVPEETPRQSSPGRAGLTMHRRLRRQLDESLGEEPESSPRLRKLFRKIEKEYRRADGERASLQHALALLSDLLRRPPESERRRASSPRVRSVSRLFD